ncbi:hypothetical protein DV515_00014599 [Chloebia gouldiae]|uniref:Uncharacterized protein n=1 Tax=Chloebia gouldiae TaxID=44316 RepID=A0A3L8RXI6_CHLGU|nr:hypothetical protein DV515_00014599 [Chloebia gouldiae]
MKVSGSCEMHGFDKSSRGGLRAAGRARTAASAAGLGPTPVFNCCRDATRSSRDCSSSRGGPTALSPSPARCVFAIAAVPAVTGRMQEENARDCPAELNTSRATGRGTHSTHQGKDALLAAAALHQHVQVASPAMMLEPVKLRMS